MGEAELDSITKLPRTANDQYTVLTQTQMKNINKEVSPFFHVIKPHVPSNVVRRSGTVAEPGSRIYMDRYCAVTNPHLIRGMSKTQSFGWIDHQWGRFPATKYNTCRERASVRWGPNKSGERTRSHNFGESIDRYTTIDTYRRNPTNNPGRVVMDCGRPAEGYYLQKYPSRTTWFGSSVPLNRTTVLDSVYPKTWAQYDEVRAAEVLARTTRTDDWPDYSEYTDKFLLRSKTLPRITTLEERKKYIATA